VTREQASVTAGCAVLIVTSLGESLYAIENLCRESHTVKGVSRLFPIFTTFLSNYGTIETREFTKIIR